MALVSDMSGPPTAKSGTRLVTRFDAETPRRAASSDTVTLDKIGDFLELDFRRLFVWLRRGILFAIVLAVTGGAAGLAYGILATPRYTVSTDILIDPSNLQVVDNDLFSQPGQVDSQLLNAGSKLRVLTSGNVLARVVDTLDLVHDPEFYDPTPSSSVLGGSPSAAPIDPKVVALASLRQRVSTSADEKSYVATLLVSAQTPEKAVKISDALVQSFKDELAKADADGASRAAAALDDRLNALKSGVETAENKVETYRRAHNLAAVDGQLVSTQTMTQLNSQVGDAETRVIAAQSTYDSTLAAGRNPTSTDAIASTTLTALRDKIDALRQELNADSVTYGPRHPTIVRLNAELAAVNGQLKLEVNRITAGAKSSLDQAKASLDALTAKQKTLTAGVFSDNAAQVELRELQRDADSKSALYQSFLTRARQITEREQIDTTNVRVISTAVPPAARSWPPRTVITCALGGLAGFVLGLLLAIAVGILRDLRKPSKRSRRAALAA